MKKKLYKEKYKIKLKHVPDIEIIPNKTRSCKNLYVFKIHDNHKCFVKEAVE
jgi:hypothetical protein